MNCEKCHQPLDPKTPHVCSEKKNPVFKPTYNFTLPKAPSKTSVAFETTSIALTDNAPKGLTIEEILSRKPKINGLMGEIKSVISTWKAFIKKPTKANIILLSFGMILFILWVWTKYVPGPFTYLMPGGIRSVFAVLLGSFNNIPARILHFSSIITLISAFIPPLMQGNPSKIITNFKSTFILTKKVLSYKKSKTLYVGIIAFGVGMFFSNYLMRNNSQNKYVVCLTLGLTVMLSTTGLFDSTFIRLSKGLYNDILRLLKLQKYLSKYRIVLQLGFGGGLILSYLACIIRGIQSNGFTDHFAYYLGSVIIIAGIVLMASPNKKIGKSI